MKKIFLYLCLFSIILTGCGKRNESTILKEFKNIVENTDSYYLDGTMELVNNEDVYTYKIAVSYEKEDHYKIALTNVLNNHEQIILRNEEGVYIVTPSLNKSFKFQSDWPYNNSQVYLLASLLDDITNDENRSFESTDEGYIFTSTVNYPNNAKLVSQKVYFGDNYLPKRVEVVDSDGNAQIKMIFDKIDLKTEFNDNYFSLDSILSNTEENSTSDTTKNDKKTENSDVKQDNNNVGNNNQNGTDASSNKSEGNSGQSNEAQEPSTENSNTNTKETATIDDIIYPMYLPANTYLTKQERVSTDDGERLILTFTGDSSFVLVEETAVYSSVPEIIPTYGSPELIGSSLAVINDNSANWFDSGIEYYIVSDVMATDELLQVVRSISVLPVSK